MGKADADEPTPEQTRAYLRRWERVNEREREELRAMTIDEKLRQVAVLMASAKVLGWDQQLDAEDAEVRERWRLLRERLNG